MKRPQFPIIPDGGAICNICGRFCIESESACYKCNPCGINVYCCSGCSAHNSTPSGGRGWNTVKNLRAFHDRNNHWPLYSIDLV